MTLDPDSGPDEMTHARPKRTRTIGTTCTMATGTRNTTATTTSTPVI